MARPKKTITDAPSVSQDEFSSFKKSVEDNQTKMLDLMEAMLQKGNSPVEVTQAVQQTKSDISSAEDAAPQIPRTLEPQFQRLLDKTFDPNDGFRGHLNLLTDPEDGRREALTFTIYVPKKWSNASDAHWKFYKQDERMIALRPESIARDIEKWAEKVAKNIHYNIKIKLK